MAIDLKLIDKLLADYKKPEDIIGEVVDVFVSQRQTVDPNCCLETQLCHEGRLLANSIVRKAG